MVEVLEGLKNTNIVYSKNVSDLKAAIEQRYPHSSSEYKAKLFAHAVHKLIDRNISHFDQDLQTHIKNSLLQNIIKKDVFNITAYDVFEVCNSLDVSHEHYTDHLTEWINTNQSIPCSKEQVCALTSTPTQTMQVLKDGPCLEDPKVIQSSEVVPDSSVLEVAPSLNSSSNYSSYVVRNPKVRLAIILVTLIISLGGFILLQRSYTRDTFTESVSTTDDVSTAALPIVEPEEIDLPIGPDNHLQDHLQYKEINEETLSDFLTSRNSILADEPYFNSIIDVAREFNINPLLMFAITGQEQGFVPKDHPYSDSIANNPFNVFGSWEDFNTDIKDTSKIAARTILNLSKGCPEDADPIKWLNNKYAEDPNWHVGVSQILKQLENIAGN